MVKKKVSTVKHSSKVKPIAKSIKITKEVKTKKKVNTKTVKTKKEIPSTNIKTKKNIEKNTILKINNEVNNTEQQIPQTENVQQQAVRTAASVQSPPIQTSTIITQAPSPSEPTPIFKDDTEKININPAESEMIEGHEKESNFVKIIGITLFTLMGLFWLIVIVLSISVSPGPHEVERNVTTISYVGEKISFSNLMNITDIAYKENITALGYLRKESAPEGALETIHNYIVDDNGNKIKVSFKYANITAAYDNLFVMNKTTKKTFNITGTYKFSMGSGFILDVSNITAQDKKLSEVRSFIIQNVTEGPNAGIRFNIAWGMKKVTNIFK